MAKLWVCRNQNQIVIIIKIVFAYSVFTKSIGSGKESRFTLFNREFKKEPVKVGDIIYCKGYQRDGEYFKLTAYDKVL